MAVLKTNRLLWYMIGMQLRVKIKKEKLLGLCRLYDAFTAVTAQNSEFLLNFPMGTFSVDIPFSVHFLKISASGN